MLKQYLLQVATLVSVVVLGGCARYEYVAPDCDRAAPEPGHSQIAWQHAGPPGRITGRIVKLPGGAPAPEGRVVIQGRGSQAADASGSVTFEKVPQGNDSLIVYVIGHSPASTAVELRRDTGVVFMAVMSPMAMTVTDGCGFVLERRRKPWWKVW